MPHLQRQVLRHGVDVLRVALALLVRSKAEVIVAVRVLRGRAGVARVDLLVR